MTDALRPISFLSDYGYADEFVGVVHGVVLRVDPRLTVVDVSHEVPRGNVRAGALMLLRAVQYLPPGVCLAVVDPGVGGDRRPIAAETAWGHFVGPDNGLLAPAVAMVGGATRVVTLESEEFRLPRDGVTFDGRDIFAPAAAVLASGEATLDELGPDADPASLTPMLLPLVEHGEATVDGEVLWVDGYGNAQTNIAPDDLTLVGARPGAWLGVRIGGNRHEMTWVETYGTGPEPVVHVDSYGLMAIAVPGGRADEELGIAEGISIGMSTADAPSTSVPVDLKARSVE